MTENADSTALVKVYPAPPAAWVGAKIWRALFGPPSQEKARVWYEARDQKEFHSAVMAGDTPRVREMLALGVNPVYGILSIYDLLFTSLEKTLTLKPEVLHALLDYKLLDKLSSTYVAGLLNQACEDQLHIDSLRSLIEYGALSKMSPKETEELLKNAKWRPEAAHFLVLAGADLKLTYSETGFYREVLDAIQNDSKVVMNGHTVIGPRIQIQRIAAAHVLVSALTDEYACGNLPPEIQKRAATYIAAAASARKFVQVFKSDPAGKPIPVEELPFFRKTYGENGEEILLSLHAPKHLSFGQIESGSDMLTAEDEGIIEETGTRFHGLSEHIKEVFEAQKDICRLTRDFNFSAAYAKALPAEVQRAVEEAVQKAAHAVSRVYVYDAEGNRIGNPFFRRVFNHKTEKMECPAIDCEGILVGAAEAEALVPAYQSTRQSMLAGLSDDPEDLRTVARALAPVPAAKTRG